MNVLYIFLFTLDLFIYDLPVKVNFIMSPKVIFILSGLLLRSFTPVTKTLKYRYMVIC